MSDTIACPSCAKVNPAPSESPESGEFCVRCDYPLFWTPTNGARLATPTDNELARRRLPGERGLLVVGTIGCPTCGENNPVPGGAATLSNTNCFRCGKPLVLGPIYVPSTRLPPPVDIRADEPTVRVVPVAVTHVPPRPWWKPFPWILLLLLLLLLLVLLLWWLDWSRDDGAATFVSPPATTTTTTTTEPAATTTTQVPIDPTEVRTISFDPDPVLAGSRLSMVVICADPAQALTNSGAVHISGPEESPSEVAAFDGLVGMASGEILAFWDVPADMADGGYAASAQCSSNTDALRAAVESAQVREHYFAVNLPNMR